MKKSILKKVLTVIVTMAMFTMFSQPMVEAATTKFISEVVLAYGDDDNEAKQKLKDAGYSVLPKNLNVDASKLGFDCPCVYMGYKTSTNVDDAITDFSVMEMSGGYQAGSYEEQLKKSFDAYKELADDYRIAAAEFKKNYDAGNVMAQAAYKQMNFYIDDDTQMLMGDFMMNIPSDDALATFLLQGNMNIVSNIGTLLTMGVAGTDDSTLLSRIEENAKTPENFTDQSYYEDAVVVSSALESIAASIKKNEAMAEEVMENQDEELDEDDFKYADIAALCENLKSVKYGEKTLLDFIKEKQWAVEDLYPMVAAMTDGQRALARLGSVSDMFIYNATKKEAKGFDDSLAKLQQQYPETLSVYIGVDRSIFTGNYAFTTSALRAQADTGDSWLNTIINDERNNVSAFLFGVGAATTIFSFCKLFTKFETGNKFKVFATFDKNGNLIPLDKAQEGFVQTKGNLISTGGSWATFFKVSLAVGMVMMAVSVGLTTYNYYHPDYEPIPEAMIDIIELENGDHYVKYDAVMNVETEEDGTITPGDLNAFCGRQWNALYVTKDFTAGKPLTTTSIKYSNDSSKLAKGYAPVHCFGEEVMFNLNEHQFDSAKPVYLSFKQSNAKKTAEKVPDVIATNISYGIAALTGGVGLAAGMGIMGLISRKKRKETNLEGEK